MPIVPASWQSWTNYVQSVDYNMSEKDQFRFRYIYNKENSLDNNAQLAAFFVHLPITYELANFSEYHAFTPTINNEFRFGFNRFSQNYVIGSQKYPGLDQFPNITLFDLGSGLNVGPDPNAPQINHSEFLPVCRQRELVKRQAQPEDRRRVPLVYFAAGVHPTVSR